EEPRRLALGESAVEDRTPVRSESSARNHSPVKRQPMEIREGGRGRTLSTEKERRCEKEQRGGGKRSDPRPGAGGLCSTRAQGEDFGKARPDSGQVASQILRGDIALLRFFPQAALDDPLERRGGVSRRRLGQ